MMKLFGRWVAVILLIVGLSAGVSPVRAQDCAAESRQDAGLMTADAVLARPAGVVATVAGFAMYLISSPFSALGGNSEEAWQSLVASPANYTFKRPLGHFECTQPVQADVKHHGHIPKGR
ncbi:MAG: hypothetical protein GXY53_09475 [Desulfobulbus sp.]|nr:hypothetical protein [Desulfobulbus sp.]